MPKITSAKPETAQSKKKRSSSKGTDPSSVLEMLRAFIEDNGYQAGQALPPERTLAETFGVGRPAVREGIKALSILDVLESRRGAGTYLKSLAGLRSDWPAKVELPAGDFNLLDLLEVRKMIEPTAARLAAARATEEELFRIEEACSQIEKDKSWENISQHDLELHAAIIEAAGNPVLTGLNRAMTRLSRKSREVTGHTAPDRRQMLAHHRLIVNSILRGEGEAAERAMLEHLHFVGLDLISNRKR